MNDKAERAGGAVYPGGKERKDGERRQEVRV